MASQKNTRTKAGAFNVVLVLSFVTVTGITALLYNRPEASLIEKRELADFPTFSIQALLTGQYTKGISDFFADTFPGRDEMVNLASLIKENSGVQFGDFRIHSGYGQETSTTSKVTPATPEAPDQGSADSGLATTTPSQATHNSQGNQASAAPAMVEEEQGEPGVRQGALYVYKGKGFQIFGGTESGGTAYAKMINNYQKQLGEKVQIYNLVIPSAIEFGIPSIYKSITVDEKPRLENIAASLDPNVKFVNVYDQFLSHKNEYLYFGTDHHWTSLAAYYAYVEFCKASNFTPVDLKSLEKRTLYNFLGTLYAQTQDSTMRNNPDHVDYYMMPTKHQAYQYRKGEPYTPYPVSLYGEYALPVNSYSVFLHGDFPLVRIDTELKNGRRIAVIKESYGNAFIPYLVNHYEQIFVVDQRYFQQGLKNLVEENQVNEVLFINNIFAAHSAGPIRQIANLLYKPAPPPATEAPTDAAVEDAAPPQPTPPTDSQSSSTAVRVIKKERVNEGSAAPETDAE